MFACPRPFERKLCTFFDTQKRGAIVKEKTEKAKKAASAGSRTRVYCLEGNYPNRWTTNATCSQFMY